jgi:hypothetical protein
VSKGFNENDIESSLMPLSPGHLAIKIAMAMPIPGVFNNYNNFI